MITPDRARDLLDGVTPGPWTASREYPEDFMQVYSPGDRSGVTDNGVVEDGDAVLIAAAPDMAETIAGMTEEWAVRVNGRIGRWGDRANADLELDACRKLRTSGTLVRRLVSEVEVVDGE